MEQEYRLADTATPYLSEREYHEDLLWLLSVLLMYAVRLKHDTIKSTDAANFSGFYMSPEEAVRYITGYPEELGSSDEITPHLLAGQDLISRRLAMTEQAEEFRLLQIKENLQLSELSFFALLCAFSCQLDRGFEQLFAMLHNEPELRAPVLGVILSLYKVTQPFPADPLATLYPGNPQFDLLYLPPEEKNSSLAMLPLRLRPQAAAYLSGRHALSRRLTAHGRVLEPLSQPEETHFLTDQLLTLRGIVDAAISHSGCSCTLLCGPRGSGKKESLQTLSDQTGARFLLLRFQDFMEDQSADELLAELLPAALFEGYLLCFEHIGSVTQDFGGALYRLLRGLAPYRLGVFLLFEELKASISCEEYYINRVDFPYPNQEQSLYFWSTFAAPYPIGGGVDFTALSSKYILTAGQIKTALQSAEMGRRNGLQSEESSGIALADIAQAVLLNNANRLSELAEPVPVFYTWDDLVLDEHPRFLLKSVCNRLRYKYQVENQWGFQSKSAYGKGISVLLFGPPGTGKTMSAQVIAGELMLPLYRIDLSRIVSKYIGETAKNLDAIFHEAKSSNVILFFDEADSLFSKRTDVKTSNDRHSNSEISYLLQKIEDYAGISILATNLAQNFDEAFRRRINYMINIHMPNPQQRLELWRKMMPEKAPIDSSVDLKLLADTLEFSGSVIKSAVIQAAYFAAEDGDAIAMSHMVRAVRLELDKLGKSEPHFMQYY